jgi:hypothetical protein
MKKPFLRISLAVVTLFACNELCFAAPPADLASISGAEPSIDSAASYPDAPSAVEKPSSPDDGSQQVHSRMTEPAMKNNEFRTADSNYVGVMGMMFASSIVAVEMTHRCIEAHTCSFVPVPLRSRGALYGIGIPAEAGVAYLSYKLKQHGHRWWFVPALAVTAANTYVAYHSSQR